MMIRLLAVPALAQVAWQQPPRIWATAEPGEGIPPADFLGVGFRSARSRPLAFLARQPVDPVLDGRCARDHQRQRRLVPANTGHRPGRRREIVS